MPKAKIKLLQLSRDVRSALLTSRTGRTFDGVLKKLRTPLWVNDWLKRALVQPADVTHDRINGMSINTDKTIGQRVHGHHKVAGAIFVGSLI